MATQKSHQVTDETPPSVTDIQALAYQLWLERGASIGSPEQDWLEAETLLNHKEKAKTAE
jgi:hypothetical protein